MPELPEAETIVKDLNKICRKKEILNIWTNYSPYLKFPSNLQTFKKVILKKKILKVERKGKGILFNLSEDYAIFVHQKMTGKFLFFKRNKNSLTNFNKIKNFLSQENKNFLHLILFLNKKITLLFKDPRKFAEFYAGKKSDILNLAFLKNLGVDPLEKKFTFNFLKSKLKKSHKNIKNFLMDQRIISGIGNIYANEILWKSKISPFRKSASLKENEIKNLHKAILFILKKAIKNRGSSISDFTDIWNNPGNYQNHFLVYQQEGKKCKRCYKIIKRTKINGRSTYYCFYCQK